MSCCVTSDINRAGAVSADLPLAPVSLVSELGQLRVTGKDAVDYFHRQLTNAVKGMGEKIVLAGYCDPKGRMLASLELYADGDDLIMMLPRAIAPETVKRLRMFVLRDDVTFNCASAERVIYGISRQADAVLEAAGLPCPEAGKVIHVDDVTVIGYREVPDQDGLPVGGKRALVIAPADKKLFADVGDSAAWWISQIIDGTATVWPATRGQFVPQAVNFELAGGVNFRKGCYPGQEVIARVHNLGKINRRAAAGRVPALSAPAPGTPVYSQGQECGSVIESVYFNDEALVFYSATLAGLENGITLDAAGKRPLVTVPVTSAP